MIARAALVLAVVSGCGGKRAPTVASAARDAGDAGVAIDAPGADAIAIPDAAPRAAGTVPGYRVIDVAHAGTVRITVEWPAASAAMRRSPGRTRCGGPRPPRARIATLHGVADAVVVLDVTAGKAPPPTQPIRLIARDCAVTPTVSVAPGLGDRLEVQSADDAPQTIVIAELGPAVGKTAPPTTRARAHLPVPGHTVAIDLDAPTVVSVAHDGDPDAAIAIAPPHPYVAVTDDVGVARFDAVPPGTHTVIAWLPPRAGAAAITVTGSITVAADAAASATLTVAP
jgi:hypothetical protein